jgi:uncharacterized protein (AIM24 family)
MVHRAETIKMSTTILGGGFGRFVGGESPWKNLYTNSSNVVSSISVSPDYPGKLVPIDLSRSGPINLSPGQYVCHIGHVEVTFKMVTNVIDVFN